MQSPERWIAKADPKEIWVSEAERVMLEQSVMEHPCPAGPFPCRAPSSGCSSLSRGSFPLRRARRFRGGAADACGVQTPEALVAPSFYANDWFRAKGSTGILFQDHGAGFNMTDNTWIRQFPEDTIHHTYLSGGFDTASPSGVNCGGDLGGAGSTSFGGFNFQVCGSFSADIWYDRNDPLKFYVDPNGVTSLHFTKANVFEVRDNGNGNAFISTEANFGGPGLNGPNGFPDGVPYPVLGTASSKLYLAGADPAGLLVSTLEQRDRRLDQRGADVGEG